MVEYVGPGVGGQTTSVGQLPGGKEQLLEVVQAIRIHLLEV